MKIKQEEWREGATLLGGLRDRGPDRTTVELHACSDKGEKEARWGKKTKRACAGSLTNQHVAVKLADSDNEATKGGTTKDLQHVLL